jgi:hypothetical protein
MVHHDPFEMPKMALARYGSGMSNHSAPRVRVSIALAVALPAALGLAACSSSSNPTPSNSPTNTTSTATASYKQLTDAELASAIIPLSLFPAGWKANEAAAPSSKVCGKTLPQTTTAKAAAGFADATDQVGVGMRQYANEAAASAGVVGLGAAYLACAAADNHGYVYSTLPAKMATQGRTGFLVMDGKQVLSVQVISVVGPTAIAVNSDGPNINTETMARTANKYLSAQVQSYMRAAKS